MYKEVPDFSPGDKIIRTYGNGSQHVFTVLDPPHTSTGKLRVRGPRGGIATMWWTPANCYHPRWPTRIERV